MEKSTRRAEKLVHATNSALAQMKFSLMFDDGLTGGEKSFQRAEAFDPMFCSDGTDLKQCQDQFKMEANEMLKKMDKMFGSVDPSRKNWKALDKIKEINRKMNALRQDHPKLRETEQSTEKLVSLLAEEKLSPQKTTKTALRPKAPSPCKKETEPPDKRHRTPKKPQPLLPPTQSPAKSKEELKSSILETRQIVDRGFHTARHLAQKVESIARKEKTPNLVKTPSEANLRSLDGKSESNDTIKSGRQEKNGDCIGGGQPSNARVVDVRRREKREKSERRSRRSSLRIQRLPSVDIRGGLQLQKIHSLEIPAGGDIGCGKANTGIHVLSHEQMEKAKMEEMLKEVKKEWWSEGRGNCVECTNCGKVMRMHETWVDPRRIDEILRKCRFNVFDPRIDEFVEKYADAWKWYEKGGCVGASAGKAEVGADVEEQAKAEVKREEAQSKAVRGVSLEGLSKKLSSKYREEAEELEGHHVRLNNLLKSLFRKIDESREVFEECHLLRNGKMECKRVLTRTEPVVVSLTEVASRRKQRLDKRDVKNRNKSRTKEREIRLCDGAKAAVLDYRKIRNLDRKSRKENEERLSREVAEGEQKEQSPVSTLSDRSFSQPDAVFEKENTKESSVVSVQGRVRTASVEKGDSAKLSDLEEERKAAGVASRRSSVSSGSGRSLRASFKREDMESAQVKAPSEVPTERSENNYESDFESLTNEPEEEGDGYKDVEAEVAPCDKKLSTISEVDSELEKKLSEEQKTQRGSLNGDGLLDEPKLFDHQLQDVEGKSTASPSPEASRDTSKAENISSLKSSPTELVTSLKEILSALKDQFARTETLAEKLTENVNQVKSDRAEVLSREYSPSEDDVASPWKFPAEKLVENLLSARKGSSAVLDSGRSRKSEDVMSEDCLSDEGGSSLGEIVEGGQRKCGSTSGLELGENRRLSWLSSAQKEATKISSGLKLKVNSEEVSYSEGEIPSILMVDSECSVGEVRQ